MLGAAFRHVRRVRAGRGRGHRHHPSTRGPCRPGDLYAALPGARSHGADFAAQAADAGAVAVLTDPAGATAAAGDRPARARSCPIRAPCSGELAAWIYGRPGRRPDR